MKQEFRVLQSSFSTPLSQLSELESALHQLTLATALHLSGALPTEL